MFSGASQYIKKLFGTKEPLREINLETISPTEISNMETKIIDGFVSTLQDYMNRHNQHKCLCEHANHLNDESRLKLLESLREVVKYVQKQ